MEAVLQVIRVILNEQGNIRLCWNKTRSKNLCHERRKTLGSKFISAFTGEVQLINLFLSIIRDYDLSEGEFNTLSDIKGIVIIDK